VPKVLLRPEVLATLPQISMDFRGRLAGKRGGKKGRYERPGNEDGRRGEKGASGKGNGTPPFLKILDLPQWINIQWLGDGRIQHVQQH